MQFLISGMLWSNSRCRTFLKWFKETSVKKLMKLKKNMNIYDYLSKEAAGSKPGANG